MSKRKPKTFTFKPGDKVTFVGNSIYYGPRPFAPKWMRRLVFDPDSITTGMRPTCTCPTVKKRRRAHPEAGKG